MKGRHVSLHADYTAEFKDEEITAWSSMITRWEQDQTNPNPFEENDTCMSMIQVYIKDSHVLNRLVNGRCPPGVGKRGC